MGGLSMTVGFELLSKIKAHSGTAKADGERIRLTAPEPLPEDLMIALKEHKKEVLAVLSDTKGIEDPILYLTLAEFERQDRAIEVLTDWYPVPIWFAPDDAAADELTRQGISRGQIWTTDELRKVTTPEISVEEIHLIATVKDEFSGKVTAVKPL